MAPHSGFESPENAIVLRRTHGLDSAELIRYGRQPTGRPRKVSKRKTEETAAKAMSGETSKVDLEVAPA